MKVFAWKLGNNGLAVKNKKSRNIVADDICDVCGQVPEDCHHAVIMAVDMLAHFGMR